MLFKDIKELQEFAEVEATLPLQKLLPSMRAAARKYLSPYLGKMLEDLIARFPDQLSEKQKALLPYVQQPLASFTMLVYTPKANMKHSGAGLHSRESDNNSRPFKYERREYLQALEEEAWEGLESLLSFLEQNELEYPQWAFSEACTIFRTSFVQKMGDMEKYVSLGNSRQNFLAMKPYLGKADKLIAQAIGQKLADLIKNEMKELRLRERHKVLLPLLQEAAAHFAAASATADLAIRLVSGKAAGRYNSYQDFEHYAPDAQAVQAWRNEHERAGWDTIAEVKKQLRTHPHLYPDYKESKGIDNSNSKIFIL